MTNRYPRPAVIIGGTTTSLAAERDALQAENARLREALRYYADDNYNGYNANGAYARAALGEKE